MDTSLPIRNPPESTMWAPSLQCVKTCPLLCQHWPITKVENICWHPCKTVLTNQRQFTHPTHQFIHRSIFIDPFMQKNAMLNLHIYGFKCSERLLRSKWWEQLSAAAPRYLCGRGIQLRSYVATGSENVTKQINITTTTNAMEMHTGSKVQQTGDILVCRSSNLVFWKSCTCIVIDKQA